MLPNLPAELVDLILSFLHPTVLARSNGRQNYLDKSSAITLGRCGRVCRAWMRSSRRILFYRVHIRRSTAHGFAKLFRKPERLTFLPYMRELGFDFDIVEDRWMVSVLPKLVRHLPPTIHVLQYSCATSSRPILLPPFPLQSITHLVISGLGQLMFAGLVSCISSFPALSHLQLSARSITVMSVPPASRPPPTLRSLDLNFSNLRPFLAWLETGEGRRIATLKLFVPHHTGWGHPPPPDELKLDYLPPFIRHLGGSLTSLTLGFAEGWRGDVSDIATACFLKLNPKLHTLALQSTYEKTMTMFTGMHISPALYHLVLSAYKKFRDDDSVWTTNKAVEAVNARLEGAANTNMTVDIIHVELTHWRQHGAPADYEGLVSGKWGGTITVSKIFHSYCQENVWGS
ncbi:hypothetical protein R3P38DRAFT_2611211 [Favolaschia claudopus]|uniref:F-box domain-containing protein n=1 Tax=Favolaschia claudopus TaxID=2862362 RepID=A0AAW0CUC2_9AGAR